MLIGYEYAVNHPTMIEASGNLVLPGNKFGKCLGGCHPLLKERTKKSIHLVNHLPSGTTIQDFLDLESLVVNSIPLCGNCRCGKCPIGSNNYSIKKERELKLIESGLKLENGKWIVTYPWKRDPNQLPNNEKMAMAILKSTEKRLMTKERHAELYKEQLLDMLSRDAARKVT